MIGSISALQNMEMQLYGGMNYNTNAPSYTNGYVGNTNWNYSIYSPTFGYQNNSYYPSNMNFRQTIPPQYSYQNYQPQNVPQQTTQTQTVQNQANSTLFGKLNRSETKAITDFYAKGITPTETILGAAAGQTVFTLANYPRYIAHPWSAISKLGPTEKLFSGIKDASTPLGKIWNTQRGNSLIREAYFQYHKAASRLEPKFKAGLFRSKYSSNSENLKFVKEIMDNLESAIKKSNADDIAKYTAQLQQAYVNDGKIFRFWKWIQRTLLGKKGAHVETVDEALKKTKAIAEKTELLQNPPKTFKELLKPGLGRNAILFAGMTLLADIGKISTAFGKDQENKVKGEDTNNGWKQLGQSLVKSVGSAIGWAVGEAGGKWAFAKIGAKIGTMFGPGIGTLIGGVIGFVGGGIGMCIMNNLGRGIVGHDVADTIEAENLAQTDKGQAQLLEYTIQQAQSGKAIPIEVQNAAIKVLNQYA